jgi:hypothetical protein
VDLHFYAQNDAGLANLVSSSFFNGLKNCLKKNGRSRSRNLEDKLCREWPVETTVTDGNDGIG